MVIRNLDDHVVITVEDLDKVKIRNLKHKVFTVEDNHYVVIRNLDDHMVITVEDFNKVKIQNLDDRKIISVNYAFIFNNNFYKFYKILIRS